jgi:hypothetical protein
MGNMMLPWARCFLWCKDTGATMIAPSWRHLRIGPYLRRERDKRDYYTLWSGRGYVRGPRRAALLLTSSHVSEADMRAGSDIPPRAIVVFRGIDTYFDELRGRQGEIESEMRRISRVPLPPPVARPTGTIGIHVRLGDFSVPPAKALESSARNWRLPLDWYVAALRQVRAAAGICAAARIFSDGTSAELASLLDEPSVDLVQQGHATHDLLLLAQTDVIIASGSTFSMWASFFGQRPTVWFPGQLRQRVVQSAVDLEPEFEPRRGFDGSFRDVVGTRLNGLSLASAAAS